MLWRDPLISVLTIQSEVPRSIDGWTQRKAEIRNCRDKICFQSTFTNIWVMMNETKTGWWGSTLESWQSGCQLDEPRSDYGLGWFHWLLVQALAAGPQKVASPWASSVLPKLTSERLKGLRDFTWVRGSFSFIYPLNSVLGLCVGMWAGLWPSDLLETGTLASCYEWQASWALSFRLSSVLNLPFHHRILKFPSDQFLL